MRKHSPAFLNILLTFTSSFSGCSSSIGCSGHSGNQSCRDSSKNGRLWDFLEENFLFNNISFQGKT